MIVLSRNALVRLADGEELDASFLAVDGLWTRVKTAGDDGVCRTLLVPAQNIAHIELRDRELSQIGDGVHTAKNNGAGPTTAFSEVQAAENDLSPVASSGRSAPSRAS